MAALRSLKGDPTAQAAYAVSLLTPRQPRDVLLAAFKVLAGSPSPAARPGLLAVYEHLATDGPRHDPGAYMRRALLDALRPVATTEEVPMLSTAVETYEYLPPRFKEDASLLRVGGLLVLNDLDDHLARFHAARLLVDEHTEPMSGEPALTAARALASVGETICLYQYAMQPAGTIPEVVSECLRGLTALPAILVPGVLARYRGSGDPVVLVGLFDLLIRHDAGPRHIDYLRECLARPIDQDAYRYLVIALLSARRQELSEMVLDAARAEPSPDRKAVLAESLALFGVRAEDQSGGRRRARRASAPGGS